MCPKSKITFIITLILVLGVFLSLPLVSLQQDSSLLRWLPPDSPAMQAYSILKHQYNIHEVMIVSKPESSQIPDRQISGARLVLSPDTAKELVEENTDLKNHPFFGPLLYQNGVQFTYYEIEDSVSIPAFSELNLQADEGIFCETYLNRELDQISRDSSAPWFLLFGSISLLLLTLILGSIKTSMGFISITFPGILVALALHQKFFGPLFPLSLMTPPIIFLLTITASMHRMEALRSNHKTPWSPTVLAMGTSAAGFFSLTTSSITPAIALGFVTGAGILFNLLSIRIILPLIRIPPTGFNFIAPEALMGFLLRFGKVFAFIMCLAFVISLYHIPNLVFSAQPLPMLPSQNLFRIHAEKLERHNNFVPMTLMIPNIKHLSSEQLLGLEKVLEGLPTLLRFHGAMDWVRLASYNVFQHWEIPDNPEDFNLLLGELSKDDSPSAKFIGANFIRIELQWDAKNRSKIFQDIQVLQTAIQNLGYSPVIGGLSRIAIDMDQEMLELLYRCCPVTVTLIYFALLLSGSGVISAFFALIPNLLPITMILAIQAWIGIPVDLAGSMMGAILLGISVDDTLHIQANFRHQDPSWFFRHGLKPVLTTSLILVTGFGGFFLASFGPIRQFGFYLSIGSLIAVASDVFGFAGWLVCQKISSIVPAEKSTA